jgi:hypothetical protein
MEARERALAALRANPDASLTDVAKIAKVMTRSGQGSIKSRTAAVSDCLRALGEIYFLLSTIE